MSILQELLDGATREDLEESIRQHIGRELQLVLEIDRLKARIEELELGREWS